MRALNGGAWLRPGGPGAGAALIFISSGARRIGYARAAHELRGHGEPAAAPTADGNQNRKE
jgi:hypothetical protein